MTQNVYPPTPEFADAKMIEAEHEAAAGNRREYEDPTASSGVRPDVVIREGEPVFTADNKKIGTVKEIGTQFFKVHATLRKDFWLDQNLIVSCEEDQLVLNVAKDDLDAYKLDHPAVEDALLPTDEQLRVRRMMEQELAQQSEQLEAEQAETGTPIVYNDAGDRIAAVDTQQDGDASMAELRDTERGPDAQFEPERFTSAADVTASRQSASYDGPPAATTGLNQDMDTARYGGRRPDLPAGEGRTDALRAYAEHLRSELRYVESELAGTTGTGDYRR